MGVIDGVALTEGPALDDAVAKAVSVALRAENEGDSLALVPVAGIGARSVSLAISDDVPLLDHEGVPDSDTVLDADGLGVQLALALSLTDVEQLSLAD